MKKAFAIAVAAVTLLGGTPALVRADGSKCSMCAGKMDAGKKVDKLSLVLDLNDKQKAQVKDLVDAKKKALEPAMSQMEAAHKQASDQFEAGLKKVLTAKQQTKLDAWKDQEKESCGH